MCRSAVSLSAKFLPGFADTPFTKVRWGLGKLAAAADVATAQSGSQVSRVRASVRLFIMQWFGFQVMRSLPKLFASVVLHKQVLFALQNNDRCAARMLVEGMDIADARVIMLAIVPREVTGEIVKRGLRVERGEALGVVRRSLDGAEQRFDKRVVVGRVRPGEGLVHAKVDKHLRDRLGLHLDAAVVDDDELPGRWGFQKTFRNNGIVTEALGFDRGAGRDDAPRQNFAGPFVQHDVEKPEPARHVG